MSIFFVGLRPAPGLTIASPHTQTDEAASPHISRRASSDGAIRPLEIGPVVVLAGPLPATVDVARLSDPSPRVLVAFSRRPTPRRLVPAGLARLDARPQPRRPARASQAAVVLTAVAAAVTISASGSSEAIAVLLLTRAVARKAIARVVPSSRPPTATAPEGHVVGRIEMVPAVAAAIANVGTSQASLDACARPRERLVA